VPYGATDLGLEAIAFRERNNLMRSGRNVAVFEFENAAGQLERIAAASRPGVAHAEEVIRRTLARMNVDPSKVKRIFTEFAPCNLPGRRCASMLERVFTNAEVTHSFEYGATKLARSESKSLLKRALTILRRRVR
jgi:hypothetical protein